MATFDNIVEIGMAANAAYAPGMFVTAASIASHANKEVTLSFTFIDGGFTDEYYSNLIQTLNRLHPKISARRINITDVEFKGMPTWRGNRMAYARFALVSELADVDYIIYCDVDFLWLADISILWKQRDESIPLLACVDPQINEVVRERDWFRKNGYSYNETRYFNTGLLMINLKKFREDGLVPSIYTFIREHPDINFPDQTSMNILLGDRYRILNPMWMRFTRYVRNRDLSQPIVLHYVNEPPWGLTRGSAPITNTVIKWHEENGKFRNITPFKSLRLYYSIPKIILGRAIYFIFSTPYLRTVAFWALNIIGARAYKEQLRQFCVKY